MGYVDMQPCGCGHASEHNTTLIKAAAGPTFTKSRITQEEDEEVSGVEELKRR